MISKQTFLLLAAMMGLTSAQPRRGLRGFPLIERIFGRHTDLFHNVTLNGTFPFPSFGDNHTSNDTDFPLFNWDFNSSFDCNGTSLTHPPFPFDGNFSSFNMTGRMRNCTGHFFRPQFGSPHPCGEGNISSFFQGHRGNFSGDRSGGMFLRGPHRVV